MTTQQRNNRIAITGCDYFSGHELARHLLRNHRKDVEGCRVICAGVHVDRMRDLERQGAEVVQIRPDDVKQMEDVFRNCDWVVVDPMPEQNRVENTKRVLEAVKKANVQHVILISCAGAENSERWRHLQEYAEIEKEFNNCNYNCHTILRTEFPQNWFHAWSYPVEDKGQFPLSTGQERRFAPIRIEDVSCALKDILRGEESSGIKSLLPSVLGGNRHHKQCYTLTGPEALNGPRIVDELNRAVQAGVSYVDVDRNQMERTLRELRDRDPQRLQQQQRGGDDDRNRFEGQPTETQIQTILDHFDWVKEGNADRTTDDLKKITGREGQRVESFFRDNAAEFRPRGSSC